MRIDDIAPGFRVLDVWDLPTPGGKDEFPRLGALLRLDRVPGEHRAAAFAPLFETDDEWAREMVNRTVHGILHVAWVRDGDSYRGRLTVLVKPNGRFGKAYLAAIAPFRHRIVYPAMLRQIGEAWQQVP